MSDTSNTKKAEKSVNSAVEKTLEEIRKGPYDTGNWGEAEQRLSELSKILNAAQCSVGVLSGWNAWKAGKKDTAYNAWYQSALNPSITEADLLSALCGMMLYQAETGKEKMALTLVLIEQIKEKLNSLENTNIRLTVSLNSLGIGLAKLKRMEEAEAALREAMRLNGNIASTTEKRRDAIHQQSKNGYNLASLILIPGGRKNEAFHLLTEKVIPGYKEVGAETDLAAAYYRTALSCPAQALNYLILSAEMWYLHKSDDKDRWRGAVENIKRELAKTLQEKEVEKKVQEIVQGIEKKMNGKE